jgi:molybdate transport system substrate-binding protein
MLMHIAIGLSTLILALAAVAPSRAAELRVMSGGAPQAGLAVLTPKFEAQTGNKLQFTFMVLTALQQKLSAGENTDIAIVPVPVIDALVKAGVLDGDHRTVFGVLGVSVIVRAGQTPPDISTPEAFRQALLAARSVVHATPTATPSGAHVAKLLDQLGIAAAMQSKVIHRPALDGGAELVAKGEAELGIYPTSEVVHVKGVTVVGPLPAALQLKTIYGAAVVKTSAAAEAAAAFVKFLSDPANRQVWRDAGFDPPGS